MAEDKKDETQTLAKAAEPVKSEPETEPEDSGPDPDAFVGVDYEYRNAANPTDYPLEGEEDDDDDDESK